MRYSFIGLRIVQSEFVDFVASQIKPRFIMTMRPKNVHDLNHQSVTVIRYTYSAQNILKSRSLFRKPLIV